MNSMTRNTIRLAPLGLLFGSLALLAAGAARADIDITVSSDQVAPKPIAVVPFAGAPNAPTDVAAVVAADLDRSGLFKTMNRNDMLEKPSDPNQIDYRNWRAVAMDDVVIGQMRQDGANYTTRFYLMDVYKGEQIFGFDIPAAPANQLRYVAHQIADLIYEKLTGVRGYFNTQIAYITVSGYGDARRWQLIVADSDGENPRVIATSKEPLMSPSWSPDRSRLAYVGYEHGLSAIYLHTLSTGVLKKFVYERGINGAPAWSPDGTKLAITLSFETNPDIYIVDAATGARRRITTDSAIDTEPSWSPDGQFVVFTSDRGGSAQIYKAPAAGGEATRLTFQGRQNLRAEYAPDGKSLVLVNNDGSGYRIAVLDLQSGNLRPISSGPLDESPSFAPNGAVVIYTVSGKRGSELATATIDGRVHQSLRQVGSEVREPSWSPYIR